MTASKSCGKFQLIDFAPAPPVKNAISTLYHRQSSLATRRERVGRGWGRCVRVGFLIAIALCSVTAWAEPTLSVRDIVMPAGRTFTQPLDGADPDGLPLSFSVVSISDTHVTGTLTNGNRSLRLNVSGNDGSNADFTGELILELFENLTPKTTARIIQLVNSGFYNAPMTFHRVIQNFMAQGGDPLGNGTGGSGQTFDDEFVGTLTFTGFGQLAMAKASDDSNDSQFFITDADLVLGDPTRPSPQTLDFNHTIFGQMTHGFDVLTKLMATPVNGDRPVTPPVISRATVFTNTQAAVLHLQATAGFAGTADVVVRATSGSGLSTQQTFRVTVVPNPVNDPPFLGPVIPNMNTLPNTPTSFVLTATDIDGDLTVNNLVQNLALVDPFTGLFPAALQGVQFDPSTSGLWFFAAATFTGRVDMLLAVTDSQHGFNSVYNYDSQQFSLTVLGSGCSYALSQTNIAVAADAISGLVVVTSGPTCGWAAASNQGWLTILSGSTGTANGVVSYAVAANPTAAPRSGHLLIAGQNVIVTQAGKTVAPAIVTDEVLPLGEAGDPYDTTLAAFGGTPPNHWSLATGSLPVGLTLVGSTGAITGTPTVAAVASFKVQVTDSNGLSTTGAFSLAIHGVSLSPVITEAPTATNASVWANQRIVVSAGVTNVFTIGATDPGALPLLYQWIFDDGVTNDWSANSAVTHVYSTNNCGPHVVRMAVSNGYAVISSNLGVAVAGSLPITKLQATVNFGKTNADTCSLTVKLALTANYNLTNKLVTLNIGGAQVPFILDAKGKGRGVSPHGNCSLAYNKPSGMYVLTATLAKGYWRIPWDAHGMINTNVPKKPTTYVTLPVTIAVDSAAFANRDRQLIYTATWKKTGTAK